MRVCACVCVCGVTGRQFDGVQSLQPLIVAGRCPVAGTVQLQSHRRRRRAPCPRWRTRCTITYSIGSPSVLACQSRSNQRCRRRSRPRWQPRRPVGDGHRPNQVGAGSLRRISTMEAPLLPVIPARSMCHTTFAPVAVLIQLCSPTRPD